MEKLISDLIELIQSKQGEDLKVIEVSEITSTAKYVFILSANSSVHGNSLSGHIIDFLIKNDYGKYLMSKSVDQNNPWILIDSSDIIFHIFQRKEREFYNLEKLYFRGKVLFQDQLNNREFAKLQ